MKLHRGLESGPDLPKGCVATIGNFDGVHRGHQALLAKLAVAKQRVGVPSVLVTFEPLPAAWFRPDRAPARITPLAEKLGALSDTGLNDVWVLRFNAALAKLSAQDFVCEILVNGLSVRRLLVGDDFRFGRDRAGDFSLLQSAGAQFGFSVEAMSSFLLDGERVSSGLVRKALSDGHLVKAGTLLGRAYALCGRVIRGEQLGRRLGYPTANLAVNHKPAVDGVFAVRVDGEGLASLPGVASLGTRPTVGGERTLLEVHLFDYSGKLYGRRIRVTFVEKLRDEHRFESLEDLVEQMQADAGAAREILT